MADRPRSQTQPAQGGPGEQGWGSPLPAEYGSLNEHPVSKENGGAAARRAGPVDARQGVARSGARVAARLQQRALPRQGWVDRLRKAVKAPSVKAPSVKAPSVKAPSVDERSAPQRPGAAREPSWDDWDLNGRRSPTATSASARGVIPGPSSVASRSGSARAPAPGAGIRRGAVTGPRGARTGGVPHGPAAFLRGLKRSVTKPPRAALKTPHPVAPPVAAELDLHSPPVLGTRVITQLDVYSVAKVSIVFYLILLVIFVIASIFLWLVADAFGAVDSIQRSVRSLFDVKTYVLHPGTIALYTSAAGAVLAVAGTIANVLAAVIYNLISEVIGGVRVGVSLAEDEDT